MKAQFLIGAPASGSGKTTVVLGIMRALCNRGLKVQPFKCGPDYIDTWHHCKATGSPSVNLDSFMMTDSHIHRVYDENSYPCDVSVTEGVMGLFDGYDGMKGSSAEIARLLRIPVVMVVNAKSMAYSVAPILYGFKNFDPTVRIVGVIFNMVASETHYEFLRQAASDVGIESLGYLPKKDNFNIPSRHLGLTLDVEETFESYIKGLAEEIETHIDLDRLLKLTNCINIADAPSIKSERSEKTYKVAVARDRAFNFMYEENLRWLKHVGEVTFFSPLDDTKLPEADFLYLPGGYPELYLERLSSNYSMLASIHDYIEDGGKALAECGGMMYMCENIIDSSGHKYPMTGVLKQDATMENMKLCLGYRYLRMDTIEMKGHEFHYSRLTPSNHVEPSVAKAYTAKGKEVSTALFHHKNLLAGYTHLYWADEATNSWFVDFLNS